MPRKHSNKPSEQLMDMLVELTDFSWKFGIAVSVAFLLLAGYAYSWAYAYNHPVDEGTIASAFIGSFGWFVYIIPITLLGISISFAWRAFVTFAKQSHWS